ncbi:MAG: hypothetical protein ACE5JI_03965 [Acidobacteriota bacterium]
MGRRSTIPVELATLAVLSAALQACQPSTREDLALSQKAVLALFQEVLDKPQALFEWDSTRRVETHKALFEEAPALASESPKELVTLLIAALQAPERSVHLPASYILRHVTQENHGFRPFASAEERAGAQHAWREWWAGARGNFTSQAPPLEQSTLIVDEIPGRIVGNDEEPPGRILHLDRRGEPIWEIDTLKMPYDAVRQEDGGYLVNIIRARAVWKISPEGEVVSEIKVGGYPCSLELLGSGHILVAGWDDDVPGFVRELDGEGNIVWAVENLRWPWKAQRLDNGNTLIADAGKNRVFEVNPAGEEVWAVDSLGPEAPELFDALGPVYCQRLADGDTLVSIRGLSKVVELDPSGKVVWEVGPELVKNQYSAVRLWNGNTLIADGGNWRVIEIDVDKNIVWEKGGFGYAAKAYRY